MRILPSYGAIQFWGINRIRNTTFQFYSTIYLIGIKRQRVIDKKKISAKEQGGDRSILDGRFRLII